MSKKDEIKRYIAHLGAIIFNYAMFGFAITLIATLSVFVAGIFLGFAYLLTAFLCLFLIVGVIFTLGIVLLDESYRNAISGGIFDDVNALGNKFNEIVPKIIDAVPIIATITVILAIIAFILLMFDRKWDKSLSRLITLGIIIILLIAVIVMGITGILVIVAGGSMQ